jgi:CPA1 family monovalent cation:H+ antiporter
MIASSSPSTFIDLVGSWARGPDLLLSWAGDSDGAQLLYYFALVPALGITAQWIAWRTRLPGILLLLLFGIGLGVVFGTPEEILTRFLGGAESAGTRLLFPLVSLSVAVILFEGGLSLRLGELREAGSAVLRLVTGAALMTWLLTAAAARLLLGFSEGMSLLIGAILVVTGPTVISPLLRQIRPSRRVESTLKWEGIVIDPIGAVLAVLVFEEFMAAEESGSSVGFLWTLVKTTLAGLLLGGIGAYFLMHSYRRYWVPDYLQGILALAVVLGLFSVSNYLAEESGLITVTILGVILANQKMAPIDHVIELKEHLRTLLIGCLFILLGSRIDPTDILDLGWGAVAFVLVLILLIRPLAVFVSLWGSQLTWKEKLFVGCLAPRGIVAAAVASVFALKLQGLSFGQPQDTVTSDLVSITFLAILSTVTVYGLAAGPMARLLQLAQPNPQGLLIAGADYWVRELAKVLHENNVPLLVVDTNYNKISAARMAGLPAECINILSDHALEEINFGGIGRMLALTPNDEVNSLAVQEFRHLFTRAGVYQLSFKSRATTDKRTLASHLRGRVLFGEEWTFSHIRETFEAGAVFKATKLSESFRYADFRKRYGETSALLFVVSDDGVHINAIDRKLSPKPGDVVIALVPAVPVPAEHAAVNEQQEPSPSGSE